VVASLLADAAASPPAVGLYLGVLLFLWDLVGLSELSYFGHRSQEAWDFAARHLAGKVLFDQLRILAVHAAVGLIGGLLAWGILAARDWVARRNRPRRAWRMARSLGLLLSLHAFFFFRAATETPQVFVDVLYMKGGWRRYLQVVLTDTLGLHVLDSLAAVACLLFVFGPLVRKRVRKLWWASRKKWWEAAPEVRWRAIGWAAGPFLLFALTVAMMAWLLAPAGGSPRNEGPNIVILAADGVRADRLGPKGRSFTPNLNRLAEQSVVFTRAYTSLARTFPAWVNLLSGRYPHSHGVRHMFPRPSELASIGMVLPRHLARHGYETSVVSDYAGEVFGRVDLGYRRIDVPAFDFFEIVRQQSLRLHTHLLPYVTGSFGRKILPVVDGFPDNADPFLMARRVTRELRRLRHSKRFLLTAFFSTTHFPYAASYPYYKLRTDEGYRGPFKYGKTRIPGEKKPTARDIRQVRGLYDGTVAATDEAIGIVLDELERLGLGGKTIVVFTSDHGETLYEADLGMGHGDHLRGESALRIPLAIKARSVEPRRVGSIVRDVDVAPTLAAMVGHPLKDSDGEDLTSVLRGEKDDAGLSAFSETGLWFTLAGEGWTVEDRLYYPEVLGGLMSIDPKGGYVITVKDRYRDLVIAAKHRCIYSSKWKLVYKPLRAGVELELYDVEADPLSQNDLSDERPDVVERLWPKLRDWMLEDRRAVMRGGYVVPRVDRPDRVAERRSR
jgi:arylsulfatase A-like enzyme